MLCFKLTKTKTLQTKGARHASRLSIWGICASWKVTLIFAQLASLLATRNGELARRLRYLGHFQHSPKDHRAPMQSCSQANVGYAACVAGGLFVERPNEGEKQHWETALTPFFETFFFLAKHTAPSTPAIGCLTMICRQKAFPSLFRLVYTLP